MEWRIADGVIGPGGRVEVEQATIAVAALEAAPVAFAAIDADGYVVACNPAAETLLGWSREQMIGALDPSVPDAWRGGYLAGVEQLREHGGTGPELARRVTPDGDELVLAVTGYVRIPDGQGRDVVGAFFRAATDDELRDRRRNELSRALVQATRTDEILAAARLHLVDVLNADVAVALSPCAHGHLHGEHVIGVPREHGEQIELPLAGDHAWARALEAGTAVGTIDLAGRPAAPALFVGMGPPKDQRLLALVYDDEVPSDPAIHAVAGALADELWLALQRAHLIAELEGKVEILEATAAVASSVGLDLEETLDAVAQHAAAALSCERAGVYLRQPDGSLQVGALFATDIDVEEPAGVQLAQEVSERGDAVLVQEADGCPFLDGPWHRQQGAISVYGLPLRVAGRDIGVLAVAHSEANPRGFTNLCQQVASAVAQQAAIAIEHARLYRTEQDTVEQLRELDQLKADYVAGLTHDLRTPLTGLLGFTTTLRRLGDAVDQERRSEYLAAMERQAGRLVSMVEDMLLATRLEGGALRPSRRDRVELAGLVAEALESFEPARRSRIRVREAPLELVVCGDQSQLLRVVRNLIDNAVKYSPAPEPVEVVVRRAGAHVEVAVRDHGPGVDPGKVDEVFERFRTGALKARGDSSGLGLYISRGIARGHGGDVVYEHAPGGAGSVFALRLPADEDC